MSILKKGRFSRIKSFCPSEHSGLVERASDFLYKHNKNFKKSYDDLMRNVFLGNGNNLELYAVKTQAKPKITKITQIKPQEKPKTTVSQIDKFLARYGGKKA